MKTSGLPIDGMRAHLRSAILNQSHERCHAGARFRPRACRLDGCGSHSGAGCGSEPVFRACGGAADVVLVLSDCKVSGTASVEIKSDLLTTAKLNPTTLYH